MTTPTTPPTHSDLKQEAFATRKTHRDELSRGANVLIDRYLLDVVPDDDRERVRERLIAVAQRCIGAGCEPRLRLSSLPGQEDQGACLAAPAPANQVEDTPTSSEPTLAEFRAFVDRCYISHGEMMELHSDVRIHDQELRRAMQLLPQLIRLFNKDRGGE